MNLILVTNTYIMEKMSVSKVKMSKRKGAKCTVRDIINLTLLVGRLGWSLAINY